MNIKLFIVGLLFTSIAAHGINKRHFSPENIAVIDKKLAEIAEEFAKIEAGCENCSESEKCSQLEKLAQKRAVVQEVDNYFKDQKTKAKEFKESNSDVYDIAKGQRAIFKSYFEDYKKSGQLPSRIGLQN